MTFISWGFGIFFVIVTLLYFVTPFKWRWLLLLLAGCIFYISFIPVYVFFLFFLIIVDYIAAIFISKSKGKKRAVFLIVSILSTLSALFIFKYYNFFIINFEALIRFWDWNYSPKVLEIVLPIGLSFHTFQSLAYVIEVYRKKQKVEKHFGIYALYVMFYPQLMAGPIERPGHMLPQFKKKHDFDYKRVVRGLRLMLWGAFQKVVIADQCAKVVNYVYSGAHLHNGLSLTIATILFAFQIYCDFDGYTNIARGAARVMGFNLMLNFRRPYLANTIKGFWKRWHISLSTWFRDYIYIPLGGSRVGYLRHVFNIAVTFLLSGLWHGANWTFVVWGGLHGLYLILFSDKIKSKFIVFILVTFAWIFFRAESLDMAFYIISHLFSDWSFEIVAGKLLDMRIVNWLILIISIFIMFVIHNIQEKRSIQKIFESKPITLRWALYYVVLILVLIFSFQGREQFIYFQF